MKIYYEPPPQLPAVEEAIERVSVSVPLELQDIVTPLFDLTRSLYSEKTIQFFELIKYKIMWALRFIEADIDSEDGHFKITADGGLEMNDFSSELCDKIREQIAIHFKK